MRINKSINFYLQVWNFYLGYHQYQVAKLEAADADKKGDVESETVDLRTEAEQVFREATNLAEKKEKLSELWRTTKVKKKLCILSKSLLYFKKHLEPDKSCLPDKGTPSDDQPGHDLAIAVVNISVVAYEITVCSILLLFCVF